MKRRLQGVQAVLRRLGLLRAVEGLRCGVSCLTHARANHRFLREHPDFPVPPVSLAYDAYAAVNWPRYFELGRERAAQIVELAQRWGLPGKNVRVMEWGCGPARIVRHLPERLGPGAHVTGTDYNAKTIRWAQQAVPQVEFVCNRLLPPLPFSDESYDLVFAVSVFTHLARESGLAWSRELHRVLRPGGLFIFTTHGDYYRDVFLPGELQRYECDGCFVRARYEEGKKMFMAAHSPAYVREKLMTGFEVLEHIPGGRNEQFPLQDWWVARKSPDPENGRDS